MSNGNDNAQPENALVLTMDLWRPGTLGDKQRLFAYLVGKLLDRAYRSGFAVTFGEAWRTPEQARLNAERGLGIANSLHTERLAVDLNLFTYNGDRWVYQQTTEAHRPLGEWWEQQHELCRWGGRFKDGNHYSIEHMGKA